MQLCCKSKENRKRSKKELSPAIIQGIKDKERIRIKGYKKSVIIAR